jgi:hypothetical protein
MIATVSPGWTPSPARPAAIDSTRAAYSRQVIETAPPSVRTATASGFAAAVCWNARHIVVHLLTSSSLMGSALHRMAGDQAAERGWGYRSGGSGGDACDPETGDTLLVACLHYPEDRLMSQV